MKNLGKKILANPKKNSKELDKSYLILRFLTTQKEPKGRFCFQSIQGAESSKEAFKVRSGLVAVEWFVALRI